MAKSFFVFDFLKRSYKRRDPSEFLKYARIAMKLLHGAVKSVMMSWGFAYLPYFLDFLFFFTPQFGRETSISVFPFILIYFSLKNYSA